MNKGLLPLLIPVHIGTQAATATLPAGSFPSGYKLKSAKLQNGAALAADNTNFLQVSLQKLDGTEIAELDTRAAHEGALVAHTGKAMNLVAAEAAKLLGDLKVVVTKNGTGVPTEAYLWLELEKR